MPRRSDGTLKYIGGETRVLAVPRSIPFSDLKKKVEEMFKTEVAAIKYQLLSEDLDVLVSVTCDDDLSQPERYVATMPATPSGSPSYSAHAHGAVSAGNSPRADAVGSDHAVFGLGMQRVRSTPNLGGLDAAPQHFHQHAADGGGGLAGYTSSSPGRAGAGHVVSQGSLHSYYHPHHQYAPAPVHVPHHAGVAGRYDTRVYVRGSNYAAPASAPPPMMPVAVRSGRPVSRGGGGPPYSDMLTPKKATTIWD
uniref:PB1 domain-containing protein n=1 Tax=Oryza brachyantha TaxID=4533 RepID=J3M7D7_ORYBR